MCRLVSPLGRKRGKFCCKEETSHKMFGQIRKTEKMTVPVLNRNHIPNLQVCKGMERCKLF